MDSDLGAPARILSDNGANVTAETVHDILNIRRIQQVYSAPYHPQSNGMVERFNGTLNRMLRHYVNLQQDDWDQFTPLLAFAYNSTFQTSIQCTPILLQTGRFPPSLAETLTHIPAVSDDTNETAGVARRAMQAAYSSAYDALVKQHEKTGTKQDPVGGFQNWICCCF